MMNNYTLVANYTLKGFITNLGKYSDRDLGFDGYFETNNGVICRG